MKSLTLVTLIDDCKKAENALNNYLESKGISKNAQPIANQIYSNLYQNLKIKKFKLTAYELKNLDNIDIQILLNNI